MRLGHRLIGTLCVVALWGCPTVRVSTDYDPSLSFSHYKSYAWLPRDPVEKGDTRIDHPAVYAGARKAVEQNLASDGRRYNCPPSCLLLQPPLLEPVAE